MKKFIGFHFFGDRMRIKLFFLYAGFALGTMLLVFGIVGTVTTLMLRI